jgi:tRNA dimethylallyltransferase
VGKTSLSIQLAQHFKTQIVSADSRQCYKELNIGVAKPSVSELSLVKHYFINSHSIHHEVNAGMYEEYALKAVDKIFQQNNIAVMVGGTGLYVKSFCEGIDEMPVIPENIRTEIIQQYNEKGLNWLQQQVQQKDPLFWQMAEQQNPQRLMRALEVVEATGNSITTYRRQKKVQRPFNIIKIGLELPKEQLHHNINTRVDIMMQEGLEQEVRALLPYRSLNALQTVGYRELFDYFDGRCSLHQAVEKIKTNTRQYAKRQMTWFKRNKEINWLNAKEEPFQKILSFINL